MSDLIKQVNGKPGNPVRDEVLETIGALVEIGN